VETCVFIAFVHHLGLSAGNGPQREVMQLSTTLLRKADNYKPTNVFHDNESQNLPFTQQPLGGLSVAE